MPEGLRLTPSGVLWALLGAASAFGLTLLVPPLALAINVGLIMGVLVRRRIDAYGWFTIGFAIWCAVYATLAIFAALTEGSSSGSEMWPP